MSRIGYHAPAAYAFRDRSLQLRLIVPDEEKSLLDISLCLTVTGVETKKAELRMLPIDGLLFEESYAVYAADVSAELLKGGDTLTYHFKKSGIKGSTFTVPLQDAPALPPVIVSEYFAWTGLPAPLLEVYNPNKETVDLYDYEWLLLNGKEPLQRNPLANAPGEYLLPPGEMAALCYTTATPCRELEAMQARGVTLADALATAYPEACGDIAERSVRFWQVRMAERNEAGEWVTRPENFPIYRWLGPCPMGLVPRGGSEADVLYRLDVSPDYSHLHVRKFRSSLWTVDPLSPREGICTHPRIMPTPGFGEQGQFLPHFDGVILPAILPLEPAKRIHLSKGDCRITFGVTGSEIAEPTVFLQTEEKFVPYPAQLDHNGVYAVRVPYAVLSRMQGKLAYYIQVKGGLYTACLGSAEAPLTQRITDNAGPEILSVCPAEGQVLENVFHPAIRVSYFDISGVNAHTSILCLDGKNVSMDACFTTEALTYRSEKPLTVGEHTFEISLRDNLGNRTYRKVTFAIGDGKELQCFRGEVHCHTLESDGSGTPQEAMAYARDVGRADYFAVTDHSHYMVMDELNAQREVADRFNENGRFATLHGFEMTWTNTSGFWGHMNVLNTDWMYHYKDPVGLYDMYELLAKDPDAIGMFNHPDDAWGDFDEFNGRTPEADQKMCLAEIRGRHFDRGYTLMLSKGWHAAPVANEDNHDPNWTTATTTTGYVLAPSLTRENVMDAFRRRRTYTTCDNTMKIFYKVNGEWMGARLQNPDKLSVEVEIHTEHERGIGKLSLVTEDNIVVADIDAGPLKDFFWSIELDPDFDYYYLRVDNGDLYSVTSPVFVEGRDLLKVKGISYGISPEDAEMPHVVEVKVENADDKPMKDVQIDYYLTPLTGFALRALTPFASVHIGKLESGKTHTVARRFPTVPGCRRVTAVVSGWQGRERFADTCYRLLTPVRIGKQLASSSPLQREGTEIENPFPYIELYNPLPTDVSLKQYSLRLWHAEGQWPKPPERAVSLDGYTIPAGGTLTVWMRPKASGLKTEDFNTRYGTSLVEGEDLFVTEARIISARPYGRRLEFLYQKELLARITYGSFCAKESDTAEDTPLLYGDFAPMSIRQEKVKVEREVALRPGKVEREQRPAAKKGGCRRNEAKEAEKAETRRRVLTKLTKAPLVPLQAARLVANAVSALKSVFLTKE